MSHRAPSTASAYAEADALIISLQDRINELVPEALAKTKGHLIIAMDPWLATESDRSARAEWAQYFGNGPAALVLPIGVVLPMLAAVLDDQSQVHAVKQALRVQFPKGHVRILAICGHTVALKAYAVGRREPELINGLPLVASEGEFQEAEINGEVQTVMTAMGTLKWLLIADVAEFKEERRRKQVARLQERARAAWAAEQIKTNPRSLDEVLAATFDVKALDDAMKEQIAGKHNAVMAHIDRLLIGLEVVS